MKYFLDEIRRKESGSTCYHEFFMGCWNKNEMLFWKDDSINIHDDDMCFLKLNLLIASVIPEYDCFGETYVSKKDWDEIVREAKVIGGELYSAVLEADPWAKSNFEKYPVFTILGI